MHQNDIQNACKNVVFIIIFIYLFIEYLQGILYKYNICSADKIAIA